MDAGARRQDRRADLRDAARRAILQHGTAVKLNQVAREAGLTSGAVLYHYPDLKDLLLEANHAGMERFYEQRMKAIADIADPAEKLVATVRAGLPVDADDPDVRLLCELGGSAGRNRIYGALLSSLYDRQVSMYQMMLDSGQATGVFTLAQDSRTLARNIVALEDGYGYRIVAQHPTIGYEEAVELILDYARLATGHPLGRGR
ncbi:MAG: TetR/AcrR family transcriptional regulator [Streptosporangiales bacterium]